MLGQDHEKVSSGIRRVRRTTSGISGLNLVPDWTQNLGEELVYPFIDCR
jgi:hypothetical protein